MVPVRNDRELLNYCYAQIEKHLDLLIENEECESIGDSDLTSDESWDEEEKEFREREVRKLLPDERAARFRDFLIARIRRGGRDVIATAVQAASSPKERSDNERLQLSQISYHLKSCRTLQRLISPRG